MIRGYSDCHAKAFADITLGRKSVRGFLPQQVESSTLERLFELSLRCPSWANTQPWRIYLLTGTAVSDLSVRLLHGSNAPAEYEITPPSVFPEPFRSRRKVSGVALYQSLNITRADTARAAEQSQENLKFFGAPHVAIVTSAQPLGPYAQVDVGLFLGYVTLAAESLGLGSIVQASIAARSITVRAALEIPQQETIVAAVSLGWPDTHHPANQFRTERATIAETVKRVHQLSPAKQTSCDGSAK